MVSNSRGKGANYANFQGAPKPHPMNSSPGSLALH